MIHKWIIESIEMVYQKNIHRHVRVPKVYGKLNFPQNCFFFSKCDAKKKIFLFISLFWIEFFLLIFRTILSFSSPPPPPNEFLNLFSQFIAFEFSFLLDFFLFNFFISYAFSFIISSFDFFVCFFSLTSNSNGSSIP